MKAARPLPSTDAFVRATREIIRSQRRSSIRVRRREGIPREPFGTCRDRRWRVRRTRSKGTISSAVSSRVTQPVADGDVDRIKVKEERRREAADVQDDAWRVTFTRIFEDLHGGSIGIKVRSEEEASPRNRKGHREAFTGAAGVDEAARE